MKILQVFDLFSHSYGGGTVEVMRMLSHGLVKRGHEVTICAGDYKYDSPSLDGARVILLHNLLKIGGYYYMPSAGNVDVSQYDILHLHCYRSMLNKVLCSSARKHNIPYILDAHGSTIKGDGLLKVLKTIYDYKDGYKLLAGASRLVAETEVGIKEYKQLGVKEDKVSLIHPPIDIEQFERLPEIGKFKNNYKLQDKHIILFVGRINPIKGLDYLIKTVDELYKLRQDIALVIAGEDNGYKDRLDELISDLKIEDIVLFTGYLSGECKLSALVDADVLIQSSVYEQGARPGFESILCNTPIIVTKNTGAGEDVTRIDAGCLVEYGNINELLVAIQYILGKPQEIQAKTQKAKQWIIDNLSIDAQVKKYEQLYLEVVGAK